MLRKAKVREGISAPTGYSVAGTVREVGRDVVDLAPGDRVAAGGALYAHHAEIVAVPRNLVVRVPDGVALRHASFATMGSIAMQGVRRAAPQIGETVVVVGLGLVGQLSVQILGASGCRVIGVDPRADRVELAGSGPGGLVAGSGPAAADVEAAVFGATGGVGADAVLLCAGTASSEPINTAMRVVRQRGRVVIVGAVGMQIERGDFFRKEVELTMSCSYGPGRYDASYEEGGLDYPIGFVRWTENRNMQAFVDLIAQRRIDPEHLVADEHPLEDAPAAFAAAKEGAEARVARLLRYPEPGAQAVRSVRRAIASRPEGAIGVAVIGAGGFAAETLLPALQAAGDFSVRAVVTQRSASAAKIAQEFGAALAATDPDAALADPSVDAVVIATRHDSHARLAAAALAAGKHVFLEKPMAIRRDELEALRAQALASDRVFRVGYNRRYAPLSLAVRDALAAVSGPRVAVYRVNAGRVPAGHWTLGPRDRRRPHRRRAVSHARPARVLARTRGRGVERDGRLAFRFGRRDRAGSCRRRCACATRPGPSTSRRSPTSPSARAICPRSRIEIHAGGGSLRLDDFAQLAVHGLAAKPATLRRPDKGHRAEIDAFRDAIRGRSEPAARRRRGIPRRRSRIAHRRGRLRPVLGSSLGCVESLAPTPSDAAGSTSTRRSCGA